jgi:hypothetical protein
MFCHGWNWDEKLARSSTCEEISPTHLDRGPEFTAAHKSEDLLKLTAARCRAGNDVL